MNTFTVITKSNGTHFVQSAGYKIKFVWFRPKWFVFDDAQFTCFNAEEVVAILK